MISGRRVRFGIFILATQVLLIAISIIWCICLVLVAKNGEFVVTISNSAVLYLGIALSVIIAVFATFIFAAQIRRLGEKRRGEDKRS